MGWSCESYYDLLGVERDASPEQIKRALKKMSLSLHPDKNEFGSALMKAVNEARDTLSDETKRREYDQEVRRGNGRARGRDSSSADAETQQLKRQLRAYKQTVQTLQTTIARNKTDHELALAKHQRLSRHATKLSDSLRAKEQECIKQERECTKKERERLTLQKRVTFFEQENSDLQHTLNNVQTESNILRDQLNDQIDLNAKEKVLARKALKDERRRSADNLARELKTAKEKSHAELEHMKREISICYQCNGDGGEDCICNGRGSLQGTFTKCLNCKGKGLFRAWGDELVACNSCLAKGAKEGCLRVPCFKCKGGAKKNCSVCYHGMIKGFGILPCPFCEGDGEGCENCLGNGYVSCHYVCGFACRGHKVGDGKQKPRAPSSLQRKVAEMTAPQSDWKDSFMSASSERGGAVFSYGESSLTPLP